MDCLCNKPPVPLISVLGAPGAGKRSLVSCLTGSSTSVGNDEDAPWRIHTKYYSADVAFRVQACGPSSSAPAFEGEAIVLVFNATCQNSFSAIKSWASSNSGSTEEAGVRLVVATHADRYAASSTPCCGDAQPNPQATSPQQGATSSIPSLGQRPQWLMDAMDWCAGECFEYVECCNTDSALDQQLRLEGDVQGIARITEALQAHMWPGLVMREPAREANSNLHQSSQGVGAGGEEGTSCVAEEGAGEEEKRGAECQKHPRPPQSTQAPPCVLRPPCAMNGHEEGSFGVIDSQQPLAVEKQQQQQQQQQQEHQQEQQQGQLHQDRSQNEACQGAQRRSHTQSTSKSVEDGMERLLEQMAAAKQQCHQLPDEQRRAQAAALAMRFASMLGSDSEGDGNSTDSDL